MTGEEYLTATGRNIPILSLEDYLYNDLYSSQMRFVRVSKKRYDLFKTENPEIIEKLKRERKVILIMETDNINCFAEMRAFFMELDAHICKKPGHSSPEL